MVEITNTGDFKKWLEGRPEETRAIEANILATRCALRTLPMINFSKFYNDDPEKVLLLPLRALAISCATYYSSPNNLKKHAQLAAISYKDNAIYSAASAVAHIANGNISFAIDAFHHAYNIANQQTYTSVINNQISYTTFSDQLLTMVSYDMEMLETNKNYKDFETFPLWHYDGPEFVFEFWENFKLANSSLLKQNNWDVWIRWYEDRLHGRPAIEALEIARATLPDKLWKQGAKAVNSRILELEAEHNPPPSQTQGALNFKANDEGQLELADPARGLKHETDEDAQERHQEVLSNAQHLRNTIGSNSRTDNDPRLRELVDKFIDDTLTPTH